MVRAFTGVAGAVLSHFHVLTLYLIRNLPSFSGSGCNLHQSSTPRLADSLDKLFLIGILLQQLLISFMI